MGTELLEADLLYTRYSTGGSFDRIDNFNRVEDDIWTRGIDNDVNPGYDVYRDFYDVDITWSRSSNIDLVEDKVYPSWDVVYTNDGLERLIRAQRGDWNGSAFTDDDHDEQWTLSQTGNWENYALDLDADGVLTGANELDDDQTFNVVNELTARDTDDNGSDNFTLAYDAAGNMTDDGKDYEFVYDAFGRLRKVNNQSQALVAEYTYNGLGYRTGWHYDVDGDGTVEDNTVSNTEDPWFQFVYGTRWRITGTYRTSRFGSWTIDASPKEQFVYHNAGLAGAGGSSYVDAVILRDRDANTAWESQADGTLEERVYYCQNWRADVVALMTSAGALINQVRYDPYGKPFGIAKTDLDGNGLVNGLDYTRWLTLYNGGSGTHPFADWNGDGSTDSSDDTAYQTDKAADSGLGRGMLAYSAWPALGAGSRKGYAGYEIDPILSGSEGWQLIYHIRYRVYLSQLGRWSSRDPLGYINQLSLYGYVNGLPHTLVDAIGLSSSMTNPEGAASTMVSFLEMQGMRLLDIVARLVAAGFSKETIAKVLGISTAAVVAMMAEHTNRNGSKNRLNDKHTGKHSSKHGHKARNKPGWKNRGKPRRSIFPPVCLPDSPPELPQAGEVVCQPAYPDDTTVIPFIEPEYYPVEDEFPFDDSPPTYRDDPYIIDEPLPMDSAPGIPIKA